MIRKTIQRIKQATLLVRVPSTKPEHKRFPFPNGTGFFISHSGYFITANHVIKSVKSGADLMLDQPEFAYGAHQIRHINIVETWSKFDLALLKVDFSKNSDHPLLKGRLGFFHLDIEFSDYLDGTPVYSYGYPLPKVEIQGGNGVSLGIESLCPRVTSAIISSHHDVIGPFIGEELPKWYVIDKALNYGNSGGPIIITGTGKVIAACCLFQPVSIPQQQKISITVPSLYSICSSLANIKDDLRSLVDTKI